jgi:hypothetical protein
MPDSQVSVGQSRRASLLEAAFSTAVGFLVAVATQAIVLPVFGVHLPLTANLQVGVVFTLASIVRGYLIRRLFEAWRLRGGGTRTAAPARSGGQMVR